MILHRGWGLRCLNDIPAGNFICIYAGQLLNDEGANEVFVVCYYFILFNMKIIQMYTEIYIKKRKA